MPRLSRGYFALVFLCLCSLPAFCQDVRGNFGGGGRGRGGGRGGRGGGGRGGCAGGWKRFGRNCYRMVTPEFEDGQEELVNYVETCQNECKRKGGFPASVLSKGENDFLTGLLGGEGSAVTGLVVLQRPGSSEYSALWTDGTPVGYTNWRTDVDHMPRKPNVHQYKKGGEFNCGYLWASGVWDNWYCFVAERFKCACKRKV